jgi:hypothetical protein
MLDHYDYYVWRKIYYSKLYSLFGIFNIDQLLLNSVNAIS